jgi:hypothetical protein
MTSSASRRIVNVAWVLLALVLAVAIYLGGGWIADSVGR